MKTLSVSCRIAEGFLKKEEPMMSLPELAAWVTGRFGKLNALIGSYETYDDELYATKAFYAIYVDMDELKAEGDHMVGDDIAEEGIKFLQTINFGTRTDALKTVAAE